MKFSEDIYQLIDRFLAGEMSVKDQIQWESLASDSAFMEEVEVAKLANELILEMESLEIRELTKEVIQSKAKVSKIKTYSLVGVGLVMTSLIGGYSLTQFSEKKNEFVQYEEVVNTKEIKVDVIRPVDSLVSGVEENSTPSIENKNIETKVVSPVKSNQVIVIENKGPLLVNKGFNEDQVVVKNNEKTIVVNEEKKVEIPCPVIKFEVSVSATCENKSEGSIFVSQNLIKGGEKPYLISLDNKNYFEDNLLSDLKQGVYQVFVKDVNSCVSSLKTTVNSKQCNSKKLKVSLNPRIGDQWEYSNEEWHKAQLRIISKSGISVFEGKIEDYKILWEGRDLSGKYLTPGLYFFEITKDSEILNQGELYIID